MADETDDIKRAMSETARLIEQMLGEVMKANPHTQHFGVRVERNYQSTSGETTVRIVVGMDGHLWRDACPPGRTFWIHRD